jgi:N-acetylglucosamine kinase-like BadF-type ATPase
MTGASIDILAIDGGNSKTDVALVTRDGRLLGAVRGPTISHQQVGHESGMRTLHRLVMAAAQQADVVPARAAAARSRPNGGAGRSSAGAGTFRSPIAAHVSACLAGADFASDVRKLEGALHRTGLGADITVLNDAFAGLRAGSSRSWGVAVIMGQGVNVAGIGRAGRRLHHAPGDATSGDWGGGRYIGEAALAAAIRARDGRGPHTSLERIVPGHFGLSRPGDVTRAIYQEGIASERLAELAPAVFEAAGRGDVVARSIVDGVAEEAADLALSALRVLRLVRSTVDVVLCGGVFRTHDQPFHERIRTRVEAVAKRATVVRLTAPPVLGAALLGLDRLPIPGRPDVEARLRAQLTDQRLGLARIR